MPAKLVRYVAIVVLLLGITMLALRNNSTGIYDIVRITHILTAVGLVGLYEVSLARAKRTKTLNEGGRQLSWLGRISLTLALTIGLFLLVTFFTSLVTGATFSLIVNVHATVGIIAVVSAGLLFTRRYLVTQAVVVA